MTTPAYFGKTGAHLPLSIGIDPDVHNCAVAVLFPNNSIEVFCIRSITKGAREAALAVVRDSLFKTFFDTFTTYVLTVEGQDVSYTGRTCAKPNDVMNLALITGAAISRYNGGLACYSPLPREWKGTVAKDIKQKRILTNLGIKFEMKGGNTPYPVPLDFEKYTVPHQGFKVNAGDWKDLTDAVGLAVWGREKYLKESSRS